MSIRPPNLLIVFFSFFITGVPVKPMKQAFGSAFRIRPCIAPVLAAVAFVHQDEDVVALVPELAPSATAVSNLSMIVVTTRLLVPSSSLARSLPALGLDRLHVAVAERLVDLVVQVHAVGHQHDLVVGQVLPGDGLGQHHHRQRLAAPLGVPDHAALAPPFVVPLPDPLQDRS